MSVVLIPRTSVSAEERFRVLATQWHKETGMLSSPQEIYRHSAYQQIIGMGAEALPFILDDLRENDGMWFWALVAITGEDPCAHEPSHAKARAVWLDWAARR